MAPSKISSSKDPEPETEFSQSRKFIKTKTQREGKSQETIKERPKKMRVMKRKPVKVYSVNANHLHNKMMTLKHTSYNRDLDFVHITEAGLGTRVCQELKKLPKN